MIDSKLLSQSLHPTRPTAVVDIGANPVDGDPPYKALLDQELCTVTGFEPHPAALQELLRRKGPFETYLPDAVGDGATHDLHVTAASGMTSLLMPDAARLRLFNGFSDWGKVIKTLTLSTRRLDDIEALREIDLLKIDIQGGELMVFAGGRAKLAKAVAIQTEVSFIPFYQGQPCYAEIDLELRAQGFVPHSFFHVKRWAIAPMIYDGNFRVGRNQLLEADVVYVRDWARLELMDDEQLKHLSLVAHGVYNSTDLAYRCLLELAERRVIEHQVGEEYRAALGAHPPRRIEGAVTNGRSDSGRNNGPIEKYRRDAQVLEKALEKEPENARHMFDLAQSYRDGQDLPRAERCYRKRAAMGGWDEEVWYSLFQSGILRDRMNCSAAEIVEAHLEAFNFRPTRAEPLVAMARYFRTKKQYGRSLVFAQAAMDIPKPQDTLFLDSATYEWRARDEYAIATYWLGRYEESLGASNRLLEPGSSLPEAHRERVQKNQRFALNKLGRQ